MQVVFCDNSFADKVTNNPTSLDSQLDNILICGDYSGENTNALI